MTSRYHCAHCDLQFDSDEAKPRCPQCMRRNGVEDVATPVAAAEPSGGKRWLIWGSLALLAVGAIAWAMQNRGDTLQRVVPSEALSSSELSAYVTREGVDAPIARALFTLEDDVAAKFVANGSSDEEKSRSLLASLQKQKWWASNLPAQALNQDVRSASEFAATMNDEDRPAVYPLEVSVFFTALLRQHGVSAVVGECWSLGAHRTPLDPSGLIGFYVSAVGAEDSTTWLDPFSGRRIDVATAKCKRRKDTEVVGAFLGLKSLKSMVHDFDPSQALKLATQALKLHPRSPQLRLTHALVLLNSGGAENAFDEMRSAVQLRSDAATHASLAEVHLARASMAGAGGSAEGMMTEVEAAGALAAKAIAERPDYARAHLIVASVHMASQDTDKARLSLEAAKNGSIHSIDAAIGWVQYHLELGEFDEAKQQMIDGLRDGSGGWRTFLQAAQVFLAVGDRDAMLEQVEVALESVPAARRSALRQQISAMLGPDTFDDGPDMMPAPDVFGDSMPSQGFELKLSE